MSREAPKIGSTVLMSIIPPNRIPIPPFKFNGLTHKDMEDVWQVVDSRGQKFNLRSKFVVEPEKAL